ncbi:helix-turn-helix domain-containing protein [uncultured Rhodospira sp.]|uniref:helix-turn-helix transcriptional regulator n=1 Tax=uncultured Rhodospira sp. TaxID=1936189 RepID=UPI002607DD68|nr:helix-turn-helix domain-containing protein [uncultured Rhodospira sp.]
MATTAFPSPHELPDPLMTQGQAAAYLSKTVRTLERWRRDGVGPRYLRVGRTIRYRRADVDAWLGGREYASQAEELAAAPADQAA